MSYKNSYIVYVNGINRTSNAVMTLKWGNFLDERLDEMYLSLRRIKKAHFEPSTSVEFVLSNKQYIYKNQTPSEITPEENRTKYYLIANDDAEEIPFGSGFYNHDLYLIEVTKYAERIVCDTQTITNDLGRYYDLTPSVVEPLTPGLPNFGELLLKPYYTPMLSQSELSILPFDMVWKSKYNFQTVRVFKDGELLLEFDDDEFHKIVVSYGYYEIQYGIWNDAHTSFLVFASFGLAGIENELPLKKWTITDVINRLLDLSEPIRKGEKPRFRLNGMRSDGTIITPENKQEGEEVGQAYRFEKILSPQLSFTKEHLRECLQEVGKVIHGEPRLIPKKDAQGWYFEVLYDMYGSGKMSHISKHKPYQVVTQHAVESFCSALDSSAENLINTLDKYSGVISEPFQGGYKTVRTENSYVRVTDSNMIISTQYPIYSIDKVEYNYNGTAVDITPYLFESSEYSRLSSYAGVYPVSKLYALRFVFGQRNIDGLNFKQEKIDVNGNMTPFGDYSIVAILKKETGNRFDVDPKKYPEMQFRVTYTPIYNTRVSQTKAYYKDVKKPSSLFYNQQSNLVETRSYGENMKGAVARLGNIEKTISYLLYNLYSVPKAGEMFDEDYMISAVAVEFLPTYIKCTVALTKDFNRISKFIGISSVKRYSEISETQALERNVLYREYIVIGDEETPDGDTRIGDALMQHVADTFMQENTYTPISCVVAWGTSYKGNDNSKVILPVISSAFGNSMSFSWKYEDNYSAGDIVFFINSGMVEGSVQGYFQNSVGYSDYHGRIYYYNFFLAKSVAQNGDDAMSLPRYTGEIPSTREGQFFATIGQEPYILRKDNREALQVNVQVDFVTNRKNMIIGSALASYCPAVRGSDPSLKAKLYVFPDKLDKFIDHVEGSANVTLSTLPSADIEIEVTGLQFKITAGAFPASGKAWAIVTNQYFGELKHVEDDKGNVTEQCEVNGGDVLIAENVEFSAGQEFTPVFFTAKREVFDKTVWKDRR